MQCNAQAGREDHKQVAGVFTRDIFQTFLECDHDRYLSESLYDHISFQTWGYFAGGGRNRAYRFVVFGQSYFADTLPAEQVAQETPILAQAREWLDEYFSGKEPDFTPKLHPIGSPFRQEVWRILLQIPYGQTMTYGEIARQMEKLQNRPHMSAQAVGGAVGHNGISIIIPCHRVVGTKGNLTGYAGGLDKKMALLELEHANRKTYPENLSL